LSQSPQAISSHLCPPPTSDATAEAQAILASQRADRERIRQEKAAVEKKLQDSMCLVHHFTLDLERAERQLEEAEHRVGETRARMRANGLLTHTGYHM
jgi:predicted  nucleic acid-binding Zn-ribbon protein